MLDNNAELDNGVYNHNEPEDNVPSVPSYQYKSNSSNPIVQNNPKIDIAPAQKEEDPDEGNPSSVKSEIIIDEEKITKMQ